MILEKSIGEGKKLKLDLRQKGRKDLRIKEVLRKRKKNDAGMNYKFDTLSFLYLDFYCVDYINTYLSLCHLCFIHRKETDEAIEAFFST